MPIMDSNQLLEMIKSPFFFNFRTGNGIVETFLTVMIIMLSTYLFNLNHQTGDLDLMRLARFWYLFKHSDQLQEAAGLQKHKARVFHQLL